MTKRSISYSWLGLCLCSLLDCTSVVKPASSADTVQFAPANAFQLAAPSIKGGQALFDDQTNVALTLPLAGAQLHYTIDGSEPTVNAEVYKTPLRINRSRLLKVRAFHPEFKPSETVKKQFVKLPAPIKINQITMNREPHKNYPGTGAKGLTDRQKGTTNFRTKHWMGFNGGDLVLDLRFENNQSLKKVTLSLLSDQGSWIFLPDNIVLQSSEDAKTYLDIVQHKVNPTKADSSPELIFEEISIPETDTKYLRVKIMPVDVIPDWHPGKGTAPWLFIDEILLEAL